MGIEAKQLSKNREQKAKYCETNEENQGISIYIYIYMGKGKPDILVIKREVMANLGFQPKI